MNKDMLLVKHIMVEFVVTANSNITVKRAIETLYEKHVGSIVVVDDDKKCIGIFTERDAIRLVAKNAQLEQPVANVMTKNVVTVQEETSLDEARRLIFTHKIRHLPVVNKENKLVGLLSVRWLFDQLFGLHSPKC